MNAGPLQPADLPPIAPFDPVTMIQSLDERGVGLRVVFYRRADRYGHVIASVQQTAEGIEELLPLLSSEEGDPQDNWPPSPVLQSLSIEPRTSGAVALLVGMAGRSHWSASVEAKIGTGEIEFDIACRVAPNPGWLGSSYGVINEFAQELADTKSGTELVRDPSRLRFLPRPVVDKLPARWQYRVGGRS